MLQIKKPPQLPESYLYFMLLLKFKSSAKTTTFILRVIMQNLVACAMYTSGVLMESQRQILIQALNHPGK